MCYPHSIVWTHPAWLNDKKSKIQYAILQYNMQVVWMKFLKAAEVRRKWKSLCWKTNSFFFSKGYTQKDRKSVITTYNSPG